MIFEFGRRGLSGVRGRRAAEASVSEPLLILLRSMAASLPEGSELNEFNDGKPEIGVKFLC